MTAYDITVIGSGPAGSSTAYLLARAGFQVLLLDRAKFPRIKPCGGGVTARALGEAPVDLAPVIERTVRKVRFSFRQGQCFEHAHNETLVYMTQRRVLDSFLAEKAAEAGAEFKDKSGLVSLAIDGEEALLSTEAEQFRSRVVVGADGANGVVARELGLKPVSERQVALEANFSYSSAPETVAWEDALALDLGTVPGGYSWSFPKQDHFNVGSGGWHGEGHRLRAHLQKARSLYALDDADMVNLQGHHLPLRGGRTPITRGPALLVGDAAGLIDPMSGEGIYGAFVSARLASESIQRYLGGLISDFSDYESGVEATLMGDIEAARTLRYAYDSVPRASYFALRHSGLLRGMLCQLMTGQGSYEEFMGRLGPAVQVLRWLGRKGEAARAGA